MIRPMPAETSQVSDPDWTRSCAWAEPDSAASATAAAVMKVRNMKPPWLTERPLESLGWPWPAHPPGYYSGPLGVSPKEWICGCSPGRQTGAEEEIGENRGLRREHVLAGHDFRGAWQGGGQERRHHRPGDEVGHHGA